MNSLIVTLRLYFGEISYDQNGDVKTQNQLMKLRYNVLEWRNFINTALAEGISKIDIVRVCDEKNNYAEVITPLGVLKDIDKAMNIEVIREEGEINELVRKEMDEGNQSSESPDDESAESKYYWVEKYIKEFGKKPHHKKSVDKMRQEIEENQN